jgi:hypothetical protein
MAEWLAGLVVGEWNLGAAIASHSPFREAARLEPTGDCFRIDTNLGCNRMLRVAVACQLHHCLISYEARLSASLTASFNQRKPRWVFILRLRVDRQFLSCFDLQVAEVAFKGRGKDSFQKPTDLTKGAGYFRQPG